MQETLAKKFGPHPFRKIMPERRQAVHVNSSRRPSIDVVGVEVSGLALVDNAVFWRWVFETYGVRLLDMEGAAVAHIAFANDLTSVAVRSLVNLAGDGACPKQMEAFLEPAVDSAATAVKAMLRECRTVAESAARRGRAMRLQIPILNLCSVLGITMISKIYLFSSL
ncbi:MAG: hypothetical protein OXL68_01435 [Paracoccaceae bacterium]|nr:hypothetical protein [Paracoccaceae bacterium]